jgi:hypothetical protein
VGYGAYAGAPAGGGAGYYAAQPQYAVDGASGVYAPQMQPQPVMMMAPAPAPFMVVNPQYTAPLPAGTQTVVVVEGGPGAGGLGAQYVYVDDENYRRALLGLLLSWIPIVGWVTYCAFCGAPRGSRTRRYAVGAGLVATLVFVAYVIAGAASG